MATKTIPVTLPEELRGYVERKVKGGRYHDASEVVSEALRQMECAELSAELGQFQRAFAGGHDRAETVDDIRRVERAVKAGRQE
jgi:putative addiction module CopG family antidote